MNKTILRFFLIFSITSLNVSASSISIEGDAAAYFLNGYSGIVRKSFDNGLDIALGGGAFNMPHAVVESSQSNNNLIQWEARCNSIQVFRFGYRFSKPYENGFMTHLIFMNQNWNVKSRTLADDTSFNVLSKGISGGYIYHVFEGVYIYPNIAYTLNDRYVGNPSILFNEYHFAQSGWNGSVHVGIEF